MHGGGSDPLTHVKSLVSGRPLVRPLVAALSAFALAGMSGNGCSTTSTPAGGNGDDGGQIAPPTGGDDGSTTAPVAEASTDDGNATVGDGSTDDGSVDGDTTGDSGEGGGACVAALYGSYVVRWDGKLLEETVTGLSGSETTVLNASSGSPLGPVLNVQDGAAHGCAAIAGNADASGSGSAWCWRTATNGNASGQLGSGTTDTDGPLFHGTQVLTAANQPLTNVASVADGAGNTACAVTGEGKLYCWGDVTWLVYNGNGGTTVPAAYAVPITTDGTTPLTNVLQAAVHFTFACALVSGPSSNEVWCWGFNNGNVQNLGVGDNVNHQYPTRVVGPSNPTAISIADFNGLYGSTCVVDGANVRCWGETSAVGNVSSNGTSPALVELQDGTTPLGTVVDLKRGINDFCTLNSDSTVWCWGATYKGYASQYAATNVTLLGQAGGLGGSGAGPSFLTNDGVYHIGSGTRMLSCGPL
jgi:hypothetical protein